MATKSLACDSFGDILFPTGKLIPVSPNTPDRRLIDPVSSVRPEHSQSINPLRVSAVEWQARTEAAALYRALYMYDMGSDLTAQCVMHRIPGTDKWLMGEWGVYFEEQTASKLLNYDFMGNLVHLDGTKEPATPARSNMGCVPIPPAIIATRPEVHTVIHVHPLSVMAVGGLEPRSGTYWTPSSCGEFGLEIPKTKLPPP